MPDPLHPDVDERDLSRDVGECCISAVRMPTGAISRRQDINR